MSRKIYIALALTLISALLVVGVASAAGPNQGNGNGRGGKGGGSVGLVVAVTDDQITVEKIDGTEVVILIDENTRFFDKDSEAEVSLAEIEVGMWVGGRVEQNDAGDPVALAVVILPADFDPEAVGTGEGRPDDAGKGGNGQQAGNRGFGTLVSITDDTVVVETEDGETLTLSLTDDTRFFSQDDSITGIEDLEAGQTVGFAYVEAEDGSLELHTIGAGDGTRPQNGEGRPDGQQPGKGGNGQQVGTRGFGTIVSITDDTVVVETEDGETLTLALTEDTRFFSQDDSITSIDDLAAGQTVGFGYAEAEDGSLELHGIGASDGEGRPDGQRPGCGNGTSGSFARRDGADN